MTLLLFKLLKENEKKKKFNFHRFRIGSDVKEIERRLFRPNRSIFKENKTENQRSFEIFKRLTKFKNPIVKFKGKI